MKVLFCELLYPVSHSRSNSFYIHCLSKMPIDLYVMAPQGLYDINNEQLSFIQVPAYDMSHGKISYRINEHKYVECILNTIKKYGIQKIILASGDYISVYFLAHKLKKNSLYLVHHAELDVVKHNVIKYLIFSLYKNSINHLVFEQYIKGYLIKHLKIDADHVFYMPHSLNHNSKHENKSIDLVGLSNSNSEAIVGALYRLENEQHFFEQNNLHVVLKSKVLEYDDGFLRIIANYIPDNEYNALISRAKCIFLPFPVTFRYRESGTLMDAFSNSAVVIGTDIPLIREYAREYPDICMVFKNIDQLCEILTNKSNMVNIDNQFAEFEKIHSEENYISSMGRALNGK